MLGYIREVSQGDDDLLPGLVQFTEGWLEKVQHHEGKSRRTSSTPVLHNSCETVYHAYWYSREQSQCSDDQGMQLMSRYFCRWRSRSSGGRRTVLQAWSPTSRCGAAVVNPHAQSQHDHSIAWRTALHWVVPWCNAVLSCCVRVSSC